MTTAQKVQNGDYNGAILKAFKAAGLQLFNLVKNANPNDQYARYRRQQLAAIASIVVKLDKQSQDWVDTTIPGIMRDANAETNDAMRSFDDGFSFSFAGVNQEAVKYMTSTAASDFGNTMRGLKASGEKAILDKRALQQEIVQSVIQGSSSAHTQNQLLDLLKKQGFTVLRAGNGTGRRFSLEDYSNLLVRTQTIKAYNVSAQNTMLAAGRRFAIFPTIPAQNREPDDPCWKYEKQKYVDLLKDPVPPLHPRCRHVLQPVSMEQLQAERPDLYRLAVSYYQKTNA